MDPKPSRGSEASAPLTRRASPVFVDRTGHRVRRVRTAAIAGVAVVGLSLGLAVACMLGVPTVVSPLLPSLPAPAADAGTSSEAGGPAPVAAPEPTPSPPVEPAEGSTD
ncbi:MAG TPA: hypothetical protein VIP82_18415, partial [Microbacterium sp.]